MPGNQGKEVISGVTTLVYLGVVAFVLLLVLGSVSTLAGGPFTAQNQSVTFTAGEWTQIDSRESHDVHSVDRVVDSTGYAIQLSGSSESFWRSTKTVDIADDSTWTVCAWASVSPSEDAENRTMTVLSADGRAIIQYNGTGDNWSAWYYDDGSTNSYRVNVSAPNQPGNLTQVCAWYDGSTFAIYRNATRGEAVDTAKASIKDADLNASHWDGRQDEVRTFDEALNASQRNATYQKPVSPLANATRTARIYFDSGSGTTEPIFFAAGSARLSNVSWVLSGMDGQEMVRGQDHALSDDGDGIRIFESSTASGAPTVWISYQGSDAPMVGPVIKVLAQSVGFLAVVGIVIIATVVMFLPPSGQGAGRQGSRRR